MTKAMKTSKYLLGALLAGTSLAQSALAQEDRVTEEIYVTSQQREQSVQEIPFTVNAVSGEELLTAGVTDVFSLQTQVPGLDIRTTNPPSAGGAFVIRGLGTGVFNLGFEPSVGTFIDGIYRARSGLVAGFDFLDLERVEVLKGPQGTLFGKNTTAGLISFVTKKPTYETEGMFRAEYGNYDRVNLQGVVNVPVTDTLAVRLSGSFVDDDGYINDIANAESYAEKHRYNLRGQVLFEPNEDLSVRIIADYAKADEATLVPIRSSNNPENVGFNQMLAAAIGSAYPDPPLSTRWETAVNQAPQLDAEDWGISAQIDYDFGGLTLTSLTSYRSFEDRLAEDNDYVGVDTLTSVQANEIETFTQEIRLGGSVEDLGFAQSFDWIVGGYYANEQIRRFNSFIWGSQVDDGAVGAFFGTVPGIGFTDDLGQDADTIGIFSHTITQVTDAFTITAGVRWSKDDKSGFGTFTAAQSFPLPVVFDYGEGTTIPAETDDSGVSGTVSLGYQVSENANLYATYTRGFKAGGVSLIRDAGGVQQGLAFGPPPEGCMPVFGPVITCTPGDPTFNKETTNHFEVGAKTDFGIARINAALFYTKVKDLQNQSLTPAGTFDVVNVGEVKSRGVDLDASVFPVEGLELSGGIVYAKVTDQDGNDINHAPRWIGGFGATYENEIADSGLNGFVHGDISFKSSYFTTNDLSSEENGYQIVNARAGVRGEDNAWEVSVWCRNCTNTNFRTIDFVIPIDGGGLNNGQSILSYLGEPRFYGVTAQINY